MDFSIPSKCSDCQFCGEYETGFFKKKPFHCCEMVWTLLRKEYRVDPEKSDINCPFKNITLLKGIQCLADRVDITKVNYKKE